LYYLLFYVLIIVLILFTSKEIDSLGLNQVILELNIEKFLYNIIANRKCPPKATKTLHRDPATKNPYPMKLKMHKDTRLLKKEQLLVTIRPRKNLHT